MHPEATPTPAERERAANRWLHWIPALLACFVPIGFALAAGHLNPEALLLLACLAATILGALVTGGALLVGLQAGYRLAYHQAPAQAVQETVQAVAQAVATPLAPPIPSGMAVSVTETDEFLEEVERHREAQLALARAELEALNR